MELEVDKNGNTYTERTGEVQILPKGSQPKHKGKYLYVRMGVDTQNDQSWQYKLYNFGIGNDNWNNYRRNFNPDAGELAVTAVNPHTNEGLSPVPDVEHDAYCTYHADEGFLGGDSGNDELTDLVGGKLDCVAKDNDDDIDPDEVKNLEFGTNINTQIINSFNDAGGSGLCIGQPCDIDRNWKIYDYTAIHDFGEWGPSGELARGEERGSGADKWFICRGDMNFYNISVNGNKHMCIVPDGQYGGNWMEVPDCRPGFSFEFREGTGWDCYADETREMNVNFLRIHNVRDASSGYEAGIMIEDSELQKFDEVFGMPITSVEAECWIGEPSERPSDDDYLTDMEEDPRSGSGYEDELWMLDSLDYDGDNNVTAYSCIYSVINDEGSETVYEGSDDPPFKTSTTYKVLDVSNLPYTYNPIWGEPFDYPYPSGSLPDGTSYDEDPMAAFPYTYTGPTPY
jgi:hypothetical protein